jgi:CheY-like chemotaxis protein
MMGGVLAIDSKLGAGSTFSFTMPFEVTEDQGTQALRMLADARILIFDEDLTSLAIVEDYAHTWGVDTTGTDNRAHALALMKAAHARGSAFDAVLVDHVLPGEEAYELAERVRAEPTLSTLRTTSLGAEPTRYAAASQPIFGSRCGSRRSMMHWPTPCTARRQVRRRPRPCIQKSPLTKRCAS